MTARRLLTTEDLTNIDKKIAEAIDSKGILTCSVVTELPSVSEAKENVLYLKKVTDYYESYLLINNELVLISGGSNEGGSSGGITEIPLANATTIGGVKVGVEGEGDTGDLTLSKTGQLKVKPVEYRFNLENTPSGINLLNSYISFTTIAYYSLNGYFGFAGTTNTTITISKTNGLELGTYTTKFHSLDGVFERVRAWYSIGYSGNYVRGTLENNNKRITFYPDVDVTLQPSTFIIITSDTWNSYDKLY